MKRGDEIMQRWIALAMFNENFSLYERVAEELEGVGTYFMAFYEAIKKFHQMNISFHAETL